MKEDNEEKWERRNQCGNWGAERSEKELVEKNKVVRIEVSQQTVDPWRQCVS